MNSLTIHYSHQLFLLLVLIWDELWNWLGLHTPPVTVRLFVHLLPLPPASALRAILSFFVDRPPTNCVAATSAGIRHGVILRNFVIYAAYSLIYEFCTSPIEPIRYKCCPSSSDTARSSRFLWPKTELLCFALLVFSATLFSSVSMQCNTMLYEDELRQVNSKANTLSNGRALRTHSSFLA